MGDEDEELPEQVQIKEQVEDLESESGMEMDFSNCSSTHDSSQHSSRTTSKKRHKPFANTLMLSEWLKTRPEDLESSWTAVPCPVGRHCLIVASKGRTRAYRKSGQIFKDFQSCLPGGAKRGGFIKSANCVLDAIWSESRRTFYILDCLAWNSHWLVDSEAEMRFFVLDCKFREEINQQTDLDFETTQRTKTIRFQVLPRIKCDSEEAITELTGLKIEELDLDGILFYHSESRYTPGKTPLVLWLKPEMVRPVLYGAEDLIEEDLFDDADRGQPTESSIDCD